MIAHTWDGDRVGLSVGKVVGEDVSPGRVGARVGPCYGDVHVHISVSIWGFDAR